MKLPSWTALLGRQAALLRSAGAALGTRYRPPPGDGQWLMGLVMAADGPRRYYLFRPAGVRFGERLPVVSLVPVSVRTWITRNVSCVSHWKGRAWVSSVRATTFA